MGISKTGKVAARALILYFSTTVMAVILGLILVSSIQPGYLNRDPGTSTGVDSDALKLNTADTFLDLFRNLIPDNLVEMGFQMYASEAKAEYAVNETTNETYVAYFYAMPSSRRGLNVLGLVVFCATFGAMLASLGERGQPMITFFEILNEVSIKIIHLVMWFSPIGILSLVCVSILEMEDPEQTFASISFYMLTVLVGLFVHGKYFGLFYLITLINSDHLIN